MFLNFVFLPRKAQKVEFIQLLSFDPHGWIIGYGKFKWIGRVGKFSE